MGKMRFSHNSKRPRKLESFSIETVQVPFKPMQEVKEVIIEKHIQAPETQKDSRARKHLMTLSKFIRKDLAQKIEALEKKEVDLSEVYKLKASLESLKVQLAKLEEKDKELFSVINKLESDMDLLFIDEPKKEVVYNVENKKPSFDMRMFGITLFMFFINLLIIFLRS